MKKLIICITVLVSLTACPQKKDTTMVNQNPNITAANYVDELAKQVRHYPKEPIYILSYTNSNCFFEVLVNDIPVFNEFERQGNSAFDIDQAIFKNGQQKITYRLFPVGKMDNGKIYDTFLDNTYLELALSSYDNSNKVSGETVYTKYRTPSTVIKQDEYNTEIKFEGTGKTYYENNFTIDVNVPYQLPCPFANAQDLRKIDPKKLEAKLLQKYQEMTAIYHNKDYDNIARIGFDVFNNQNIGQYEKKENINTIWQEEIDNYKLPGFQMQPIENYKLQFYADGRLVALMQNSADKKKRGNSILWAKMTKKEGEGTFFSNNCFYIPQGETEFKVY